MCSENLRNVLDNRRHNYARLGSHLQSVKREPKKYQFGSWHFVSRLCCDAMQKHKSTLHVFLEPANDHKPTGIKEVSPTALLLLWCWEGEPCGGEHHHMACSLPCCPTLAPPAYHCLCMAHHHTIPSGLVCALTPMLCPNTQCMPLVGTGTTSGPLAHRGPVPMCSLGSKRNTPK